MIGTKSNGNEQEQAPGSNCDQLKETMLGYRPLQYSPSRRPRALPKARRRYAPWLHLWRIHHCSRSHLAPRHRATCAVLPRTRRVPRGAWRGGRMRRGLRGCGGPDKLSLLLLLCKMNACPSSIKHTCTCTARARVVELHDQAQIRHVFMN